MSKTKYLRLLPRDFNWKNYRYLNKDLEYPRGNDYAIHYVKKGSKENRPYQIYFEPYQYWLANPDLRERFGKYKASLLQKHWLRKGILERRPCFLKFTQDTIKPNTKWSILTISSDIYLAELLALNIRRYSKDVSIEIESFDDIGNCDWYVVINPLNFERLPPKDKSIFYQTDVIDSENIPVEKLEILESSSMFLDSSIKNIELLLYAKFPLIKLFYLPIDSSSLDHHQSALKCPVNEKEFEKYFDRFLFSTELVKDDHMNALGISELSKIHNETRISKYILSLPESYQRNRRGMNLARSSKKLSDIKVISGFKMIPGWRGCALSYSKIALESLRNDHNYVLIIEDDVVLPKDFDEKYEKIEKYLLQSPDEWDIFSGMMANVPPATKILKVEKFDDISLLTIDKMISMVFNIYNRKALIELSKWDPDNSNPYENTIDMHLQNKNLKTIVLLPFLVKHSEDLESTLWGGSNKKYRDMIKDTEQKLTTYADAPPHINL